jgi:uncharacterized protein (UPF0332 family)
MTDKEALYRHRLEQAEETLLEAEKMLKGGFSSRSIINRGYYSMFYLLLALFLKTGINPRTSKHRGIISIFDKEFVKSGKIDKHYSQILHKTFDGRLEGDYKELVIVSPEEAAGYVAFAREFFERMKSELMG